MGLNPIMDFTVVTFGKLTCVKLSKSIPRYMQGIVKGEVSLYR